MSKWRGEIGIVPVLIGIVAICVAFLRGGQIDDLQIQLREAQKQVSALALELTLCRMEEEP
jgi:hypothetical protein